MGGLRLLVDGRCLRHSHVAQTVDLMPDANQIAVVSISKLLQLLADLDEWLGNEDGLMIEDIIDWRNQLADALGKPTWK